MYNLCDFVFNNIRNLGGKYLFMYQARFITLRANIRNKSCTPRNANYEGATLKAKGAKPAQTIPSSLSIASIYIPSELAN